MAIYLTEMQLSMSAWDICGTACAWPCDCDLFGLGNNNGKHPKQAHADEKTAQQRRQQPPHKRQQYASLPPHARVQQSQPMPQKMTWQPYDVVGLLCWPYFIFKGLFMQKHNTQVEIELARRRNEDSVTAPRAMAMRRDSDWVYT